MLPQNSLDTRERQGAQRPHPADTGNGADTHRDPSHASPSLVNVCGAPTSRPLGRTREIRGALHDVTQLGGDR